MEGKETFAIGDRVDQMCVLCDEERGHVVALLSKTGKITRVSCPMCNSRVPYKRGTGKIDVLFADRIRRLIHSTCPADPIPAADRTRF